MFLRQVPLVPYANFRLGSVLEPRTSLGNIAERFPEPPADAKSPGNGCLFMGGRSPFSDAVVDGRIKEADKLGYTDIHEIDVPPAPPCDPKTPWTCVVGGNPPTKYVWACTPMVSGSVAPPSGSSSGTLPSGSVAPSPGIHPTTMLAVGGGLAAAAAVALLAFK